MEPKVCQQYLEFWAFGDRVIYGDLYFIFANPQVLGTRGSSYSWGFAYSFFPTREFWEFGVRGIYGDLHIDPRVLGFRGSGRAE